MPPSEERTMLTFAAEKTLAFKVANMLESRPEDDGQNPPKYHYFVLVDEVERTRRLDKIAFFYAVFSICATFAVCLLYFGMDQLTKDIGTILKIIREAQGD